MFRMLIARFAVILTALSLPSVVIAAEYDVVVIGGTPGGIAAAVTAARLGHTVALVEYHAHLGGMSASGLGKSDIETPEAIGGLFLEFVGRVEKYYRQTYGVDSKDVALCRKGYYYEPSVAEKIFDQMVAAETRITVFKRHRLDGVLRVGKRVAAARVVNRDNDEPLELRGQVFVDGTYEGDLAASAGAQYRLGREGRHEFNELHAGVVYQEYQTRAFLAGTTGEGDDRLQAYTYRLCLTTDSNNSAPLRTPPPNYDRTRYLGYLDDWKAGRLGTPVTVPKSGNGIASATGTLVRALSIAEIPNQKYDVNMNPRPLGFPFPEENRGYPEADWPTRERISQQIRNLTLGLLYFLQNDVEVPVEHRQLAQRYHLPKDEFADNEHFPWQLYVREARRIVGLYTLSEQDVVVGPELGRTRVHADSIAAGEFPIDSFPVRKRQAGHDKALEGYLLMEAELTKPYQIPYRILVPVDVDGLLVPVAASTTHVAFSTIRLEPTWMALGQASGVAAHLAIRGEHDVRKVDVERVQRILLEQKQIVTYFKDIDPTDAAHAAVQYFGTLGFFPRYEAEAGKPLDRQTAVIWLKKLARKPAGMDRVDWKLDKPLNRGDLAQLFDQQPPEHAERAVTRGEFCLTLYQWLEATRPEKR